MPDQPFFPLTIPVELSGDRSARAHLEWLNNIHASIYDMYYLMYHRWGEGIDGVIQIGDDFENSMLVSPTTPASMKVEVAYGACQVNAQPFVLRDTWTSSVLVAPSSLPRIDVVQANVETRAITILTGVEDAAPVAPTISTNCVKLAEIDLATTTTSITGTELTNSREFTNA